jgi:hypothetical protein
LQADRHVETLVRQDKGEEVAGAEQDESGAGTKGGRPGLWPTAAIRFMASRWRLGGIASKAVLKRSRKSSPSSEKALILLTLWRLARAG